MDGSVVEGNSTSLQNCPPDPQEHLAFEDLPSFPSIPPLHENDLGLTPPPGSQQLQHANATQGSSQDEKPSAGDEKSSNQKQTPPSGFFDRNSGSSHDAAEIDCLNCNNYDLDHMEDAPESYNLDALSAPDICPVGVIDDGFLEGFDSETALRELEAALEPRKRTGDEAFPNDMDFLNRPEKKRIFDFSQSSVTTSPEDTPSLSSPDSLLRTEQADSAPHTPPASENIHSPNSLFDSLDALFEDPNFQIHPNLHESPAPQAELPEPPVQTISDLWNKQLDAVDSIPQMEHGTDHEALPNTPPVSQLTKERFGLDSSDMLSNTVSETLRVCPKPQYTSPYPTCGGPLGYFPSAPGIHVRCIEAVDRDVHHRISGLKDRVQQLTYERNKYRTAWNQWSTRDPSTGKSKEQLLREENTRLRRASSQLQNKVEEYKTEAAEWRTRLNDLSIVYNNLLYQIHVQRQMPTVAPVPRGYKPPAGGGHMPLPAPVVPVHAAAPLSGPNRSDQASVNQQPVTTTPAPPPPGPSAPPSGPSGPTAAPIMIDLTDEGDDAPAPPPSKPRGAEMIQSLRNKQYGWLQGTGQPETGAQVVSAPQSPAHHGTPNAPERSRSHPPSSTEEELVRAMEDELAKSN
ncbi:hypothetical protein BJX96DRAFT_39722 [Aspergillus floccosus]